MRFTKMHGLGNDFILIYRNTEPPDSESSRLAMQMCDRHTGVGADGLVWVYPSDHADIAMRIINADGTVADQCGNAVRCVAKYYYERISAKKEAITIETKRGIQMVWNRVDQGEVSQVCVDMDEPILNPAQIPINVTADKVVNQKVQTEGKTFHFTGVSMGNPHVVIEVEDAVSFPVETWGPLLENHELFPRKANVEFITIHSPGEITMRVWERGVGQTMACGSGACAVVVAGVLRGKCSRQATVHLKGGDLHIDWNADDNHVYMTGPATFVFEGKWDES
ncbi:diaminopimelate epimerase [Paenactinomyces guangxiensis]|uniref:Diaminopimelate epimerase n=1 Tax=Paenactinomyces guangxiensis TaxID=1490290 RepID=A0A7W2A825_9BACL|nr:diaminopimelate epimerase [Paenactinomyces guangxiensis]MBA4494210.1 diaminopimelate epimerase [Paenactinomyces guangxiensis]MBH8590706.1 diaminopimelate epimerase [Paenactinomyces guangxiensis]